MAPETVRSTLDDLLDKHGLDRNRIELEIGSMKRQAGTYNHDRKTIRISRFLLDNHPDRVEQVLLHELGHAITMQRHGTDIEPHGSKWQDTMQELGVDDPNAKHELKLADYRYILRCQDPDCTIRIGRFRKSKLVQQPGQYRCRRCGTPLERVQ
ncbi:MAG: SprT-like domain-containing protein [Candidatus Nanohaloarchaea archaeon]|nr:SprT-like domain-containing protein [Candidatus Nanohaloarchaea archaeon]